MTSNSLDKCTLVKRLEEALSKNHSIPREALEEVLAVNEVCSGALLDWTRYLRRVIDIYKEKLGGLPWSIYEFAGLLHTGLLKEYIRETGLGGKGFLNILVVEVVGKKELLSSTRIPLDLTRASLLLSDAVMYVASQLPGSIDEVKGSGLGSLVVLRPHPLVNPYNPGSLITPRDIVGRGGVNPAILVSLIPAPTRLDSSRVFQAIRELFAEYWSNAVDSVGSITKIKLPPEDTVIVTVNPGDLTSIIRDENPVPYIATLYTEEIVDKEDLIEKQFTKALASAFENHETAGIAKYIDYSTRNLELYEKAVTAKGGPGNPLCTNCYKRPYVIANTSEESRVVTIETSTPGGETFNLVLRLRPRERLCPLHAFLRLTGSHS